MSYHQMVIVMNSWNITVGNSWKRSNLFKRFTCLKAEVFLLQIILAKTSLEVPYPKIINHVTLNRPQKSRFCESHCFSSLSLFSALNGWKIWCAQQRPTCESVHKSDANARHIRIGGCSYIENPSITRDLRDKTKNYKLSSFLMILDSNQHLFRLKSFH